MARELKYSTQYTDLDALQRELSGSSSTNSRDEDEFDEDDDDWAQARAER